MSEVLFSEDLARIDWDQYKLLTGIFGVKAATSFVIPRAWTPPFAALSADGAARIDENTSLSSILGSAQLERIRSLASSSAQLIIRSSVVGESIWERGKYASICIHFKGSVSIENLNNAARKVVSSADGSSIGLMIQRYVKPSMRGEFGNLLRISKTRDHWELSTVDRKGIATHQRLNSQRDQAADPDKPIWVRAGMSQERLFGTIGAWLNNELLRGQSQRLTAEWLTDNQKFFLVQIDEEDEDRWGMNPFQVRIVPAIQPAGQNGRYLKEADVSARAEWDKLKVLEEMWESDVTNKPMLFFVTLSNLLQCEKNIDIELFEDDFRRLVGSSGIIVRTSVKASTDKITNLPRTEGLSPKEAVNWCIQTAARLVGQYDVGELAFVVHRFVGARASAWARAEPDNPNVEIHSLWGLPDALQYCPYDTWNVHVPTGHATDYPDYKSDMLISRSDGSWEYVRIKNELARASSIGSAEAKEIAVRTKTIAERLGRPCHIMWFVGCVDEDGRNFSIPWYWTEAHEADRNFDRSAYKIVIISDQSSLDGFVKGSNSTLKVALALRPNDLDLMRDVKFISTVGKVAKDHDVPVFFYGSTLAHAYYQLRRTGCTIIRPNEREYSRTRRTTNFGKLVRDKIPAKIAARHESEVTRKIAGNVKIGFLISKLFEEALEVREAIDPNQKIEELADLLEVFLAILKENEISLDSVYDTAKRKKIRSGGFDDGLVLLQTGIAAPDRERITESEQNIGLVLAEQVSDCKLEIPFSFFGFMKIGRAHSVYLEQSNLRVEIVLQIDRIEITIVPDPEQLNLPFSG